VLDALRDAEDALARYSASRDSVANAARARASAQRTAVLTRQRYNAGTATLIDALEAERQRDLADQTLTQSTATMTGYYVAIQKALGLGWQDTSAANP
jgi:outer membrane protein TolC